MRGKADVVIIGAGSAGLSALRQVKKYTENFYLIDSSELGTKCARSGCMPSKAMIIAANDFYRRKVFEEEGIKGAAQLRVDIPKVLEHVRKLRDEFTGSMIEVTRRMAGERLIAKRGEILSPGVVGAGDKEIETEKIIIAAGSVPRVKEQWKKFGSKVLTSESIFEQEDLPGKIAVIGLGAIGLELGQAMSRLGIEVAGFTAVPDISNITDEKVNQRLVEILRRELDIYLGAAAEIKEESGKMIVEHPEGQFEFDAVLAAVGVRPNVQGLGLENLGVQLDKKGVPKYNSQSGQVGDLPVFIAGDVNGYRPILHEALDEGFIAGQNSCSEEINNYCRKTPLNLVFSDPQVAVVGENYKQLEEKGEEFVIGEADFSDQSRLKLEMRGEGLVRIYIDCHNKQLLGAEMACADAEHLASLLAIGIQKKLTVFDMLLMPFYHPTVEEGLRSALRDGAKHFLEESRLLQLSLCDASPEAALY